MSKISFPLEHLGRCSVDISCYYYSCFLIKTCNTSVAMGHGAGHDWSNLARTIHLWYPWNCLSDLLVWEGKIINSSSQSNTLFTLRSHFPQAAPNRWLGEAGRPTFMRSVTPLMVTSAWGLPPHRSRIPPFSSLRGSALQCVCHLSESLPAPSALSLMGFSSPKSLACLILSSCLLLRVPGLRQPPTVTDTLPFSHEVKISSSLGRGSDIWLFLCWRFLSVTNLGFWGLFFFFLHLLISTCLIARHSFSFCFWMSLDKQT